MVRTIPPERETVTGVKSQLQPVSGTTTKTASTVATDATLPNVAIDKRELEALRMLAQELHFGRAADRLRISPSKLSRTIQSLERRVGATLFARTSRRVTVTPIGQRLLDEMGPVCMEMQRVLQRAIEAGRKVEGELTIGFEAAPAGRFILAVAERFRALNPRVDVHIRQLSARDGADWRSEHFDLVLLSHPITDPAFRTGPVLITEARMLAVPARHPLAARSAATHEDLATIDLFRPPGTQVEHRVPEHTPTGRPITYAPEAHSHEEILTRVGAGQGALVVGEHATRYFPRPDVVYLPLNDAPPLEHRLAWRPGHETALIRAFATAAAHSKS
ncbi:LysR family transcriptional regulator [Nocardia sp. NPDC051832]|uniref:LysR family transcriptional regulator n=1 Tax=Nocardia sp. NPDC051832 TaxID=3155673 RepID=UPI00344A4700